MSNNYWAERMAKAQDKITQKHIEDVEKQLSKYYSTAMKRTIADFEATYDKLQATVADGVEPTPADLYKLDRYWELQAQLKTELEKLGDRQVKLFSDAFEEQFFDIYNSISIPSATAYSTIDKGIAQQMINQIWVADGKNFNQRIWGNTEKLIETLNDELINCVATGRNTNELKQLLQERFNVSYSNADSIVRTETAHIQTQAAKQRYIDYGVQQVEVWAEKDERQCKVCGKLHKKVFNVNETIPIPAHPRCRCCIIPVVDDKSKVGSALQNGSININSGEQIGLTNIRNDIKIYSNDELIEISNKVNEINPSFGSPVNYTHTIITDLGKHGSKKAAERIVTIEDAQSYVDSALICFQQTKDKKLYLSESGVCVVIDGGRVSTVYPKEKFDERVIKILKVVKKYG